MATSQSASAVNPDSLSQSLLCEDLWIIVIAKLEEAGYLSKTAAGTNPTQYLMHKKKTGWLGFLQTTEHHSVIQVTQV